MIKLYILWSVLTAVTVVSGEDKRCSGTNYFFSPYGDMILTGMFPTLNEFPTELNVNSLLWSEVLKFTIDESNKRLGEKKRFGYVFYDTCGPEQLDATTDAVMDMLLFNIPGFNLNDDICFCWEQNAILYFTLGIVGPALSSNSIYTNKLLRFENIPQISFASTSPELSDKSAYPNFYRTVLPDTFQAKFIRDILKVFNWSYIAIVAVDSSYGRAGKNALVMELGNDTCIAASETLYLPLKKDAINATIEVLLKDKLANVIVVWGSFKPVQVFLEHASTINTLHNKTWIISEATGRNPWFTSEANKLKGTFLHINQVNGRNLEFEKYFFNLNYNNSHFNPWLRTFFEQRDINETSNSNKTLDDFRDLFEIARVGSIQNAALSYINAYLLYNSKQTTCNISDINCDIAPIYNHSEFSKNYIAKVKFKGLNQETVEYDDNGDITTGWFDLYMSMTGIHSGFQRVAQWSTEHNLTLITDSFKELAIKTKSQCSDICAPGTTPIYPGNKRCCWKCISCPQNHVKESYSLSNCTACSNGQIANRAQSACMHLEVAYIHHGSSEAIIIYSLSSIGIILTLIIIIVFIAYRGTPIVRSSNLEMSSAQLISHFLLFACPLLFIHEDTKIKCIIRTYSIGFLFVLITTTTLVKVVHIVSVFRLKYRLSRGQIIKRKTKELLLILIMVVVEICIIVVMLEYEPIVIHDEIELSEFTIYKACNTDIHFIVQAAYILLLQLICGIQAFRGRKLPAKYNEAKYMAFAMFSSTLTMVVAIPLSYSIKEVNKNQLLISVIVIIANFLVMVILYGYKIIIIGIFPQENTIGVFQGSRMQSMLILTDRKLSKISTTSYSIYNSRYSTDYGISPISYNNNDLLQGLSYDASTDVIPNPNIRRISSMEPIEEEQSSEIYEHNTTISDSQNEKIDRGEINTYPSEIVIRNKYAICEI